MPAPENFRANVRAILLSRDLSQRDLAERIKSKHPYVNRILQGTVQPSLPQCEKIARALKVRLVDLLEPPKKFSEMILTDGTR